MKFRVVVFVAAAIVAILLVSGCGPKTEETSGNQTAPLKVGLVLDVAGRGDGGFNDAAYNGLVKAQKEFGDAIETTLVEPKGADEQEKQLRDLAESKMDMIICVGYIYSGPLAKIAPKYPDTRFVQMDTRLPNLKPEDNITCVIFKDNEGSFLAGAAAALKTKTGKIGFIGGADVPVINNFETGYTAGARYVDPDIIVLSNYISTKNDGFTDPPAGKALALKQISNGADVVFHAAGPSGNGMFEAAAAEKKLAIGVDVDQTFSVPEAQRPYILTSLIKGVDKAVCDVIRRQMEDGLEGGYIKLGIKDGVETYAENDINKSMLADIKPQLEKIKNKIANGNIVVPESDDRPCR